MTYRKGKGVGDSVPTLENIPTVSADDQRRASLQVCAHAKSVDDARLLMRMLGLDEVIL